MPCNPAIIAHAQQRLGRKLKKKEIKVLDEQADQLVTVGQQRGLDNARIMDDTLMYANRVVDDLRAKKANEGINVRKAKQAKHFIDTHFRDRPDVGLEAWVMGIQSGRVNSRSSVARDINTRESAVLQAFTADLAKAGDDVLKALTANNPDMDILIAKAMWELHSPNPNTRGIPRQAVEAARIIDKHNEMLRTEANDSGAWIGKERGYLTRRGHDQIRIRQKKDAWFKFMRQHLDMDKSLRMTEQRNVDQAMETIYAELASGQFINFKKDTDSPQGFTGSGNIARGMSQHRVFHFKTPEAEMMYMREFGYRNLAGSVMQSMTSMARDIAILKRLGTNPEQTFKRVVDDLMRDNKTNPDMIDQISNIRSEFDKRYWPTMSGASGVVAPGQGALRGAQIDHAVRSLNRMSLLPFLVPSQIPDIALRASALARQNRSFFGGITEAINGVVSGVNPKLQSEVLQHLGVSVDGAIASLSNRWDAGDHLPGRLSAMEQLMFKYTGAQPWTDRMRTAGAVSDSHYLATQANKTFDRLDDDLQRELSKNGIDANMWNTHVQSMIHRVDGVAYLVPTQVMGQPNLDRVQRQERRAIRDAFQGYFHDTATTGVLTPDMKTRAALTRGAQQGTLERVTLNQIAALKAFPISVLQRVVGAELLGRTTELPTGTGFSGALSSAKLAIKVLATNNSARIGMAKLMVAGTLLGYAALYIKDLIKGRTPRTFTGDLAHDSKLFLQAMAQGGALGIYADFLQGDNLKNRFGGGPITTMMGPGADDVGAMLNIIGHVATGEPDKVADDTARFIANNLPFVGTGPGRTVMDYLFLNEMMEYLNPGYMKRRETRLKKDMDQEYNLGTFSEDFLQ